MRSSHLTRILKAGSGWVIAGLCLLWIFHDVRSDELFVAVRNMTWSLVAGAIIVDLLSYLCQAVRWSMLLLPVVRVPVLRAAQAIYAGLFVNELMPMRLGELLRIYLISRSNAVSISSIIPSTVMERFFDAVWLASAFGIAALFVPLPAYLVRAEKFLGYGVILAIILLLAILFFYRPRAGAGAVCTGRPGRFANNLRKLLRGIRETGTSPLFFASGGTSMLLLAGQALSYWLLIRAYGLQLTFWQGAVVFLIVHIGTAVPGAPSNVGTYQFFTVVGLTLFGIDKTAAAGFSIVVFLLLTIPLWFFGMLAFSRTGISLKTVRAEIANLAGRC